VSTHAENVAAYRDLLIANAVKARKIAPDRADDYRRLFDADPHGVKRLLTAPVEEGGLMAGVAAVENPLPPVPTDYPREWIGERRPGGNIAIEDAGAIPAPQAPRERITIEE
jgi:hypothetical protein